MTNEMLSHKYPLLFSSQSPFLSLRLSLSHTQPPFLLLIHLLWHKADGFTFNTLITIRINNNNILQQSRVDRKDAHATRTVYAMSFGASSSCRFPCISSVCRKNVLLLVDPYLYIFYRFFFSSRWINACLTWLYPTTLAKPMRNPRYEFHYKCFHNKTIFLNRILL